jgi:hypothetical protein
MVNNQAQGVVNFNLTTKQISNYLVTRGLAKKMINVELRLRRNIQDLTTKNNNR